MIIGILVFLGISALLGILIFLGSGMSALGRYLSSIFGCLGVAAIAFMLIVFADDLFSALDPAISPARITKAIGWPLRLLIFTVGIIITIVAYRTHMKFCKGAHE